MSVESVPAVKQTIAGWNVSIGGAAQCQYCRATLGEGDEVTAYAYRPLEEQLVSVARLYCSECDHRGIKHPALGCYEWLAEARLALTSDVTLQLHSLSLAGIEIVGKRSPQEGDTL